MLKKWFTVLFCVTSCFNVFSMQNSQGWLTASKKVVDSTCQISTKVVHNAKVYAMPVTIGGIACLALIYATVPAARVPMYRAGSWVGNKLYDAYSRICYEIQVRPLVEENNRIEQQVWGIERNKAELQNQINTTEVTRNQLRNQERALTEELNAVAVRAAHINQMTGAVQLVTAMTSRLATLMRNGFGACNDNLGKVVESAASIRSHWQESHTILTQSVPFSLEEKKAVAQDKKTASNDREQLTMASNSVLKSAALTKQQLEEIQQHLPRLLQSWPIRVQLKWK